MSKWYNYLLCVDLWMFCSCKGFNSAEEEQWETVINVYDNQVNE